MRKVILSGLPALTKSFFFLGLLSILLIGWVVYFAWTRDWARLWMPIVLILPFFVRWVGGELWGSKSRQHRVEWLQRVEDRVYQSKKFALTFQYVSETEYGGGVRISEDENGILLSLEREPKTTLLKIYPKAPDQDLLRGVQYIFQKKLPSCRFYLVEPQTARSIGFPEAFKVVGFSESSNGDCPMLGVEPSAAGEDYFFETPGRLDRFFSVSSVSTRIDAFRTQNESDVSPRWFSILKP